MPNVHIGTPPEEWEGGWESQLVHFHNFASSSAKKDNFVTSPSFSCIGHEWSLMLYPGGHNLSKDGMVSIYLEHLSGSEITVRWNILITDENGKEVTSVGWGHGGTFTSKSSQLGLHDCFNREIVMDSSRKMLEHGTLTVEVRIKPNGDQHCRNFIPKNTFFQHMLGLFLDEGTADIVFEVNGQSASGQQQDGMFQAHKLVLKVCAAGTLLASLCDDSDTSPIPISDIDPQVFRQMLYYVYGGQISAVEWKEHAKDLMEAADKYGLKSLKIEAEAWHVKFLKMKVDDVIEILIYAEKLNCFLLKETAINFIVANASQVLASGSFNDIPEPKSIMREILFSVANMNVQDDPKKKSEELSELSINDLRAKLHAKGKDFDGSKDTLIARLLFDTL